MKWTGRQWNTQEGWRRHQIPQRCSDGRSERMAETSAARAAAEPPPASRPVKYAQPIRRASPSVSPVASCETISAISAEGVAVTCKASPLSQPRTSSQTAVTSGAEPNAPWTPSRLQEAERRSSCQKKSTIATQDIDVAK